jgi:hypothetical protein
MQKRRDYAARIYIPNFSTRPRESGDLIYMGRSQYTIPGSHRSRCRSSERREHSIGDLGWADHGRIHQRWQNLHIAFEVGHIDLGTELVDHHNHLAGDQGTGLETAG